MAQGAVVRDYRPLEAGRRRHLVHYFGAYSNVVRGKLKASGQAQQTEPLAPLTYGIRWQKIFDERSPAMSLCSRSNTSTILAVAFALLGSAGRSQAQGIALGLKAGTLGAGLDLTVGLAPVLNLRVGAQGFSLSRTFTEQDVSYDGKADLKSAWLLLDVHPGGKDTRLSVGVVFSRNKVTGTSPTTGTVTINGVTYSIANVGTIDGEATANDVCPYLGLGWGNAVRPGSPLRFAFDVGVLYQGAPKISLTAHPVNPALVPPTFFADLEKERQKVEDDASKYKFYPVVNLGLSYRF